MNLGRAFLWSLLAGVAGMLAFAVLTRDPGPGRMAPAKAATPSAALPARGRPLLDGIAVRDQITVASIGSIRGDGYRTLIDLRPDGEAADQPASAVVGEAARAAGLRFAYVPTPHGDIPDAVVDGLSTALAASDKPALLYCRSGSRAARVWALAEASRPGGATAETIQSTVRGAGQQVDDLMPRIKARIASRPAN